MLSVIYYVVGTGVFLIIPSFASSLLLFFFFFKQKTAYEMRISDWSSDVCSSDLLPNGNPQLVVELRPGLRISVREIDAGNAQALYEIGRASCRERVCQYV